MSKETGLQGSMIEALAPLYDGMIVKFVVMVKHIDENGEEWDSSIESDSCSVLDMLGYAEYLRLKATNKLVWPSRSDHE